ncbi:hypothetical protein GCM10010399_43970 [Dactylosporangium fulvum]|uniref:Helix-turn-helix transcriptional regulator n=1 Tax=Dactylosporangium fulvum TaxID=53359 RepID=A0ABY5WA05_9ACTN|nr:helix-turn-helix transcriptional regulator [Dactylosporangium fulvum]UWP85936.1 helix-turn-helix transcriptional regulator [Dactylosporangium fulvum]
MTAPQATAEPRADLGAVLDAVEARALELQRQLTDSLAQVETLLAQIRPASVPSRPLTKRQRQIAWAFAMDRLPLREVAREHGISVNSAKTTMKTVYRKLGINDQSQLRLALRAADRAPAGTPGDSQLVAAA